MHHILDEVSYLSTLDRFDSGDRLRADETLSRAVVRSLEVIGEAASKLDSSFRALHPQIAWARMIAIRNRLIHDYMGINFNIVVDVLNNEIPVLRGQIETILSDLESDTTDSPELDA